MPMSARRLTPPTLILVLAGLTAGAWLAVPEQSTADQDADIQIKAKPVEFALSANERPKPAKVGDKAPPWQVDAWANLPEETDWLDIDDYKGKTIYLYCFQSWCPGCHSSGFPTLKKVNEHYAEREDVAFLAVQTVFEGFSTNTHKRGIQIVTEKFGLDIPVGQSGSKDNPSKLMRNYQTRGTPWTIIIGPDGVLRYGDFHIKSEQAIKLIDGLQAKE